MPANSVHLCEYNGIAISVDPAYGRFWADLDGEVIGHETLDALKAKIDKFFTVKKKAKKKPLSIPCINGDKEKTTVTGLHARTGQLLMSPKLENRRYGGGDDLFLDCPRAVKLLDTKASLEKSLEEVGDDLRNLKIKPDKERYGEVSEAEFDGLVAKLEARVAAARKFAEE